MSFYEFFKFFSLGSISQYGTLQQNMSSEYMTQLAGKQLNFQQLSKLIELVYSYKKVTYEQISACPKSFMITLKTLKFT